MHESCSKVVQTLTDKNDWKIVSNDKNARQENDKLENKLEIIDNTKQSVNKLTEYEEHKMNDPLWNIKLEKVRKLEDHLEVKLDSDKKSIDKFDVGKVKENMKEDWNVEKKAEKDNQKKENWLETARRRLKKVEDKKINTTPQSKRRKKIYKLKNLIDL